MRSTWLALALISGFGLACSSEPDEATDTPPPECDEPEVEASQAEPQYVGNVFATVLGLDGEPLSSDPLVQVCGLDLCINGETGADGTVAVGVGEAMKLPAFKYGNGLSSGKLALLLPSPTDDDVELGTLLAPLLPTSGPRIAAGSTASSGGVDLMVAKGASVDFDTLVYQTDDEQAFRAAPLLPEDAAPGYDQGFGFELYVALAPLGTEFCPPAELVVPNLAGLAQDAEVEFYIQGLEAEERYAPYAGFAKVAEGKVSADGETIAMQSGGLPVSSLVAIREKP